MPDDSATRRRDHGRRLAALLVAAVVTGPVLVAGAIAATDVAPAASGTIDPPAAPAAPVTPQFAPVSPAPDGSGSTPTQRAAAASPAGTSPSPDAARVTPTPDANPEPGPAGLPHAEPTRISVPDLGIESDLVRLGLHPDGSLEVPEDFALAGWYADGPAPGDAESPPAVIVGHVDSTTGPAVFYRLRELVAGQAIEVARADGSVAVFRVRDTVQYPKSALPTDEVYETRPASELVLITCSGEFDEVARSYLDNFVVTARLDREASTTSP